MYSKQPRPNDRGCLLCVLFAKEMERELEGKEKVFKSLLPVPIIKIKQKYG